MKVPPTTSERIPDAWIEGVRHAMDINGTKLRQHPDLPRIQVFSHNTGEWHDLMLFGSGYDFTSEAERDLVIARIRALPF